VLQTIGQDTVGYILGIAS